MNVSLQFLILFAIFRFRHYMMDV